jgi:asparagine synthase (glutamine-hydrolysing)
MCGIYGIFQPSGRLPGDVDAWDLAAQQLLSHRGPDGRNSVHRLGSSVLLGHTRLSIIDLAGGLQPIANEDNSVWVVFNGEIYNYIELREALCRSQHRFRTSTDTEVLVHLYEEKGDKLLADLDGMFAFALLDEKRRRLLLARDRFGEKPLYWTLRNGGKSIAFASELKVLLALPGISREIDVAAVSQYFALGYVPAPRTHIRGIHKLCAGEALTMTADGPVRTFRYWSPSVPDQASDRRCEQELVHDLWHLLKESTRLRLRSDVPVGAFLSGGIDSTMIVAAVREVEPTCKLTTFCARFDDDTLDESKYARLVANAAGTDHREIQISEQELISCFDELLAYYDEPFADPAMFPTYAICRAARQECKVLLSGDGGDEIFGGYHHYYRYFSWRNLRKVPGARAAAGILSARWPSGRSGAGLLQFMASNVRRPELPNMVGDMETLFTEPYRTEAQFGLRELTDRLQAHSLGPYPYSLMARDVSSYLPEQVLVKVDRASMRASIECRAPILNTKLWEFSTSLPLTRHFRDGQGKALLRAALPNWVPEQIRTRRKQGFVPPLASWFREKLKSSLDISIRQPGAAAKEMIRMDSFQRLFTAHMNGADNSAALFRWLAFQRAVAG